MSATMLATALSVAVSSEQALVADAVKASLSSRGFDANVLRWPGERTTRPSRIPARRTGSDVGLLISDLDRLPRIHAATLLLTRVPVSWVVLTSAPPGPMWGAAIEAGARAVLPSTTGFDEVCEVLPAVARGDALMADAERAELIDLWGDMRERRDLVDQRVRSLTPREHEVLTMLYAGDPVARIAQLLEVSPATVRSQVKSVLRKLQVNTQLGAVAALDDLLEMQEMEGLAT